MVRTIEMPKVAEDMSEGLVVEWLVQPGQAVEPGDVLFELETDKATMEVESDFSGTVQRIVVEAGQSAEVGAPVAYLAENLAELEAFLEKQGE